jgi:hypothetical protein
MVLPSYCAAVLTGTNAIIVWSMILICLIIAGMAITLQVKKKVTETGTTSDGGGGFSLSDLRQMVKDGRLTPEEFEKARAKIVEVAKRASQRPQGK